jgi:hypothetical protein
MLNELQNVLTKTFRNSTSGTTLSIYYGNIHVLNETYDISMFCKELVEIQAEVDIKKFTKALVAVDKKKCKFTLTKNGNLIVKDGTFRALIPNAKGVPAPRGSVDYEKEISCTNILSGFAKIHPFIGSDNLHIWTRNILFSNGYMYASNNIFITRYKISADIDRSTIPNKTALDLLKFNKEILKITKARKTVGFKTDTFTLKSRLIDKKWPDVEAFFKDFPESIPDKDENLLTGVKALTPFCLSPDFPVLHFGDEGLSVNKESTSSTYRVDNLIEGSFNANHLELMLKHADKVKWSEAPEKIYFSGNDGNFQGVFAGHLKGYE